MKRYTVTYISAWVKPQVFEHLSEEEKNAKVQEGKDQQYKVEVTEEPEES